MRAAKYEEYIRSKGMEPIAREKHDNYEILVSEGFSSGDQDEPGPHYKTMYAIAESAENVVVGEFFTTPILFPLPLQTDRLRETLDRAKEYLKAFKETGCLKS